MGNFCDIFPDWKKKDALKHNPLMQPETTKNWFKNDPKLFKKIVNIRNQKGSEAKPFGTSQKLPKKFPKNYEKS